jgi:hypothetical protein
MPSVDDGTAFDLTAQGWQHLGCSGVGSISVGADADESGVVMPLPEAAGIPTLAAYEFAIVPFNITQDEQGRVDDVMAYKANALSEKDEGRKKGKRLVWHEIGQQNVKVSLREDAKEWLLKEKKHHWPLATSSWKGALAVISHCSRCLQCSSAWCFSVWCRDEDDSGSPADYMLIEVTGECSGPPKLKRIKMAYAIHYGRELQLPPSMAQNQMVADEIPNEEWPSDDSIKWQNRQARKARSKPGVRLYTPFCIDGMQQFLNHPPEGVHIFREHVVITKERLRIPFAVPAALELAKSCGLTSFLMDFTFQTNREGLLLGSAGPVGLWTEGVLPHMRFVPTIMLVSDAEDANAHALCVRLLRELRDGDLPPFEHAFLDMTCLRGAEKECGDEVYLHRCLQHTKVDIKKVASSRRKNSREPRLRTDLLPKILEWVDFSAWLHRDEEFDVFWRHLLGRMRHNEEEGDLNEPEFADYLEQEMLDISGPLIRAAWQSGFGAVPLGFTTYAANAIEVTNRLLKGVFDKGFRYQHVCRLVEKVALAIETRIRAGKYANLVQSRADAWPWLMDHAGVRRESDNEKRLDGKAIRGYFLEHGAAGTFLESACNLKLADGSTATKVYVMPKYTLRFASERGEDMQAMMDLALSVDTKSIAAALADKESGVYSYARHMYLRRTFVSVYITTEGMAVDAHKHFIEACGHTEHTWFFSRLQSDDLLLPIALGPRNSRAPVQGTTVKPKPKAKTSDATLSKLRAVSERGLPAGHRADVKIKAEGGTLEDDADAAPISPRAIAAEDHDELRIEAIDPKRCMARIWKAGLPQCTRYRKVGEFCNKHIIDNGDKHGRADGPPPASKTLEARKAFKDTSSRVKGETVKKEVKDESVEKKGKSNGAQAPADVCAPGPPTIASMMVAYKKSSVDSLFKRVVMSRLLVGAQFDADMARAKRLSVDGDAKKKVELERRQAIIESRLLPLGRRRVNTPAHGDCQFIAVARSLGFPDESHGELRTAVCEYLSRHSDVFDQFHADGSWERYLDKLRQGAWGDHVTIMAMARMFNHTFTTLTDVPGELHSHHISPAGASNGESVIVHFGEFHYESTELLL